QIFYSALNEKGRAGFVMANSASDARYSEREIRKRLVEEKAVDVVVSLSSNFFYTVTLPCTVWFIDKGKQNSARSDFVLFIDAREIFTQIDRTHREFTSKQLEFLANIVRLYRNEDIITRKGSDTLLHKYSIASRYIDIPGLCKKATIDEIRDYEYSLNPGRYVGINQEYTEELNFQEVFLNLVEEFEQLSDESEELKRKISTVSRRISKER
ncbi:MAG: N-6 DNA methylase, partial [Candidatus Thorarchaeota archaeon]|nr:N-6 DNA methylase [Candidatus Thorarchaeota archaeon]